MIASTAAVRQAHGLVDEAQAGALDKHVRNLILQAKATPVRLVELVVVLAELAAAHQPAVLDTDEAAHEEHLRLAHAAFTRGLCLEWVITGEREYQRLKKRRLRKGASA